MEQRGKNLLTTIRIFLGRKHFSVPDGPGSSSGDECGERCIMKTNGTLAAVIVVKLSHAEEIGM